jgi:hypothetical protein
MSLNPEDAKNQFEKELMYEIQYRNMEYQSTLRDDDPPPHNDLIIQRHIAILRMLFHTLCAYRGTLPWGPMSQAAQKYPELWNNISLEAEIDKISKELGVPYPDYPEDSK